MRVSIPQHPKRKLGQNFLHDENILKKILAFCEPSPTDTFLEIGAGTGALTSILAPRVKRFVAVEIDRSLLPFLQSIPGIEILQTDIRKLDLSGIARGERLRVIGNLPYYISTAILNSLIARRELIQDMVLVFQEEVAQRIIAPPSHPEYGLVSALAQYYCEIEKGFRISRNCFTPRPDIESRVLRFRFRKVPRLNYDEFLSFLSRAFSQRRKKLRNNLLRTTSVTAEHLDAIFRKMQIKESARAENLSAEQYERLILEIRNISLASLP